MTKSLVILGGSGGAHDLLDILDCCGGAPHWRFVGWLDDGLQSNSKHWGMPVLGKIEEAGRLAKDWFFINAVGSDRSYRRRPAVIAASGLASERFATLVHPRASVSLRAALGLGSYVSFGASIGGNATIGRHVAVCPGCIVGHDSNVGDYTILAPGSVLSGRVVVGANAYIGARAVVRQDIQIGEGALVGMGAVVTRDVPAGAVVVGSPARVMAEADG
jgi:sugar O-acyltransferase (sialic acid O-acetyltransferase NeuD family)